MKNNTQQNKESEKAFFNDSQMHFDVQEKYVYEKISEKCCKFLRNKASILEAGCGIGKFGKLLAKYGHSVVGVDLSTEAIKISEKEIIPNYRCFTGDLEEPDLFSSNSFDLILCPGILHHFPNLYLSPVIKNLTNWAGKKGRIVVWEPNGSNFVNKLSKRLAPFLIGEERLSYVTENETNHTIRTYKDVFKRNGFELVFSESFSDKAKVSFDNIIVSTLIELRWFLTKTADKLFPFPYSGAMVFLVFEKKMAN